MFGRGRQLKVLVEPQGQMLDGEYSQFLVHHKVHRELVVHQEVVVVQEQMVQVELQV